MIVILAKFAVNPKLHPNPGWVLSLSEVGADRAPDPTAGPLPGHFSLHGWVKGQDGALQHKGAQTGESHWSQPRSSGGGDFSPDPFPHTSQSVKFFFPTGLRFFVSLRQGHEATRLHFSLVTLITEVSRLGSQLIRLAEITF